jgi:phosphonate transport system substrate-binding protein
VLTKTYSGSIRAVYIKGICDFTATYAISSDPRTSSEVIQDLPDVIDRVPIIWISPAVIPNLSFSVSPLLPLPISAQITNYLLEYSRTEPGRQQLSALNAYEIARLEALPDDAYNDLRGLLAIQNVRLSSLLP